VKYLILLFSVLVTAGTISVSAQPSSRTIADELLADDRAFSAASAKTDLVAGLSAMFAPEAVLTHAGGIAYGVAKAIEALKSNAQNAGAKIEWTPVRVSVSGDGRHGFTAGFMTLHRPDGTTTPMKYLAYWEKRKDGWRVLAYKHRLANMTAPPTPVTYVLPRQVVAGSADAATVERYRDSLAEAERSFSRDAQTMGIGAAFRQYGSPDAINLGGPDTPAFLIGNEQIAAAVGGPAPSNTSPVHWGPEKTIVAASGDFGVTIGYIVQNKPGAGGKIPPGQPFFTIWRRASPADKWLYIAE
jgi:ketosteroid isomerase-like protein